MSRRAASPPLALALAAAAWSLGVGVAGQAHAREFTPADLQRIERINQARNGQRLSPALLRSDPICGFFAVNKADDLTLAGYGPGEVAIAIVTTEQGDLHAVAEVKGTLKGQPRTIVLDSRFTWTAARQDLEAEGYSWNQEFTR